MYRELKAFFSAEEIGALEQVAASRGTSIEEEAAAMLEREMTKRTLRRTKGVVTPLGRAKKPGKRD